MLEHVILYVVVEDDINRRIQAVCAKVEEAEKARSEILQTVCTASVQGICSTKLNIHAMNATFTGDRYRLVYGTPASRPSRPLDVPAFQISKVTNTDAHSEGYIYPDELFVYRKEALAAAARHNCRQLQQTSGVPEDWAVVVEIGEPLWRRYRSECLVRNRTGWEDTDLVRPVRVVCPTGEEISG
jgi:hypothetical protein